MLSTPVRRNYEPGSRACWSAESVDEEWWYRRGRPGPTYWTVIHQPTFWPTDSVDSSLAYAQRWTADPAIYRVLYQQAMSELSRIEDVIEYEDGSTISNHDRARGLLTWLADNHPEVFTDDR